MNRRKFIIGGTLSIILLAGCSSKSTVSRENEVKRNFYQIDSFYQELHSDFDKSKLKFSKLGSSMINPDNVGIEHTLAWFYGVNSALSKSDITIKKSIDSGFLEIGFGLKQSKAFYLGLYENDLRDFDNSSLNLGFNSFDEMFNYVYLTLSTSNKYILSNFLNDLYVRGFIDLSNILEIDNNSLINNFTHYSQLSESDLFIENHGERIMLDYYDFTIYSSTLKICAELLKNKNLGKVI